MMTFFGRRVRSTVFFLSLVAGAPALLGAGAQATEAYPSQMVSMVVPFPPGGGTDISGRLLAHKMSELSGATFVVDNKPGAAGQIATDLVARTKGDGYTLLYANSGIMAINPWLYQLKQDPETSFEPVSLFSYLPFVLVVPESLQVNSVQELIERAKAEPGKLTFASSGTGGAPHLAAEMFQQVTQTDLLHIPYKGGGQALTDLMGGRVDMMFTSILETLPHIKAGKLRALAVTGQERSPVLADTPTLEQVGVQGANVSSWTAVYAPKGLADTHQTRLHSLIAQAAADPVVQKTLLEQGAVAHSMTPDELAEMAKQERERFGRLIETRQLSIQ